MQKLSTGALTHRKQVDKYASSNPLFRNRLSLLIERPHNSEPDRAGKPVSSILGVAARVRSGARQVKENKKKAFNASVLCGQLTLVGKLRANWTSKLTCRKPREAPSTTETSCYLRGPVTCYLLPW